MSTRVAPYEEGGPSTSPTSSQRVLDLTDPLKEIYFFISDNFDVMQTQTEEAKKMRMEWDEMLYQVHICNDLDLKAALRQHGYIHGIAKSEVDDLNALRRTLGSLYLNRMTTHIDSNPTLASPSNSSRIRTSFIRTGSASSKAGSPATLRSNGSSSSQMSPSSYKAPFSLLNKQQSSKMFNKQLSFFSALDDDDDDDDKFSKDSSPVLKSGQGRALRFNDISCLGVPEQNVAKSFLPNILISTLKNGPLQPRSERFYGCCMLADISGFTKFSGDMCAQGARGLDKLHRLANDFFQVIVEIVYENGGDVVAFAGDALVCIFPFTQGEERRRATEAVRCALQLAQVCTDTLTSHIGVSTGEMVFSLLGSADQFAYLLTGDCILELTSCLDDAKSKQVAVTQGLALLFDSKCSEGLEATLQSRVCDTGTNHIVEALVFADGRGLYETCGDGPDARFALLGSVRNNKDFASSVHNFVPNPVLKSLKSGSLMFLAELRELTTMFLSLDSFDVAMHKDPQQLQPVFLAFLGALRAARGFLRQFLVDDKGCVFIAFWGVPSSSYNDNAAKAVTCAATLLYDIEALGHHCSIGITTGEVYCGNIGSPVRSDYVGIGSPVNLAARLMGKAHGRILVCKTTYANLSRAVRTKLQKAETLRLKGVATDTVAYTYVDRSRPSLKELNNTKGVSHSQTLVLNAHIRKVLQERLQLAEPGAAPQPVRFTVVVGNGVEGLAADYYSRCSSKAGARNIVLRSSHNCNPYYLIIQLLLHLCEVREHTAVGEQARWSDRVAQARGRLLLLLHEEHALEGSGAAEAAAKSLDLLLGYERPQEQELLSSKSQELLSSKSQEFLSPMSQELMSSKSQELLPSKKRGRALHRSKDDRTFLRLFKALVRGQHVSLVVQDAQLIDELSWHELSTLCDEPVPGGGHVTVLLTMKVDVSSLTDAQPQRSSLSMFNSLVPSTLQDGIATMAGMALSHKASEQAGGGLGHSGTALGSALSTKARNSVVSKSPTRSTRQPTPATPVTPEASMSTSRSTRRGSTLGGSSTVVQQIKGKRFSDYDNETFTGETHSDAKCTFVPPEGCRRVLVCKDTRILEMQDLSEEDVYDVLLHALDTSSVSYELAYAVFEVSKGIPYWCDAIARFIRDNGADEFLDKFLHAEDNDSDVSVLKRLIAYRMERLSPEGQVVVKHCSVIGEEVSLQTLKAVAPEFLREALLSTHLPELVKARFLVCLEASANPVYGFQIEQIHRTCYDLMPPTDRQRIHLKVAAHLESRHRTDLRPFYPTLHHHYFYCNGMRGRCFEYAVKSADFLISKGAFGAGFDYVRHGDDIAVSIAEHEMLIEVIECALNELQSRRRTSLVGVNTTSKVMAKHSELADAYTSCKTTISGKLDDIKRQVSIGESGKMPSRLTRMFSAKEQRGSLVGKLEWKASFVERRKTSRGSGILGSACSVM